ncbi:MAG: peroxide stress protein YaaA [Planctomycetes bacterium]|nr:peroxide stress protein YaaA [Planctomycetota bacterium]
MLTVISPAKKLDLTRSAATPRATQPRLLDDAAPIVDHLRRAGPAKIAKLMGISDDLAKLNAQRFRDWHVPFTSGNARKAILAFDGDVYANLDRDAFSKEDFAFAQKHLRILSGLYGLLRPLDLIQAYRLEMGTALKVKRTEDLYDYWGGSVTRLLRADLRRAGEPVLVNLASDEYFRVVRHGDLDARVITPVFKERRNGGYKVIAFEAKRARGAMFDFIVRERIDDPEGLRRFRGRDYRYSSKLSSGDTWVFARG